MYYINKLNNSQYLVLDNSNNSGISFSYFQNTLRLEINLYLKGDYFLPTNHFYLNIISNLGNIDSLELNLINSSNYINHYKAICNIDLNDTLLKDKDVYLQSLFFDCFLKVNYESLHDLNIDLNGFIQDVNKINLSGQLIFSNYFPISKLSEYYINEKYRLNYKFLDTLPNDFFVWSTIDQNEYPKLWFNRYNQEYNNDFQVINPIYISNLGNGKLIDFVNNLSISVDYYINNESKSLKINNAYLNSNYNGNCLYLGVTTSFDFDKNELIQNLNNGVNGIYFPIKTNGQINLSFEYKDFKYKDSIPFEYKTNFYSNLNNKLNFIVENINSTQGYWSILEG